MTLDPESTEVQPTPKTKPGYWVIVTVSIERADLGLSSKNSFCYEGAIPYEALQEALKIMERKYQQALEAYNQPTPPVYETPGQNIGGIPVK